MIKHLKIWTQLKSDRRAVTAMEYGLIAALMAAVLVGAIGFLTTGLTSTFTTIKGVLTGVGAGT